jgi:hypothetical protein
MPFNGSGTYTAPSSPGGFNPAVSGQQGTPTDWNALLQDIEAALSTVICRDGQSAVTANIPMGGFKLTGLANGSASTDSVAFGQIATAIAAAIPTGVIWDYAFASPPTGWVLAYGTIGNAASGATNRANADTEALFTGYWNEYSNTLAPVLPGGRRRERRRRLCGQQNDWHFRPTRARPRRQRRYGRHRREPTHRHDHDAKRHHVGRDRRRANCSGVAYRYGCHESVQHVRLPVG